MYEQQYRFGLEGISPLIMHWDNIEWADRIEEERSRIKKENKGKFKAGDDRCPPDTWKGYTYHDGEHIAIPNDNLRSSLMRAAAKIELKGLETFKRLSQSAILFDDLFIPLQVAGRRVKIADVLAVDGTFTEQAAAVRVFGFQLFAKRAAVGQAKHVRVRPRFDQWALTGTFTVVDDQVTTEILKEMWRITGLHVGLCDWRPGSARSPGPYGRFTTSLATV